jgi:hypothetical protein
MILSPGNFIKNIGLGLFTVCALIPFFFSSPGLSSESLTVQSLAVPQGCSRLVFPKGTYSHYIQNLPIKSNLIIYSFDGRIIDSRYNVYAVVALPLLFRTDLEQCADYCMRFWAEYHRSCNLMNQFYLFDYSGHKKYFRSQNKNFEEFLRLCLAYSNSYSIKAGAQTLTPQELIPGDMVVQNENGRIGHVSMVVDVCKNEKGDRLYLMGFGFMPAQEFHIEKAPPQYGQEGWFFYEGYCSFLAEHYRYGAPHLRRF